MNEINSIDIGIENFLKLEAKNHLENVLNTQLLRERDNFLKKYKTRGNGFNYRTLKLTFDLKLQLKVPRVRDYSEKLNYSIFEKYQRNSKEFENKLIELYTSRNYEKEICKRLEISTISQNRKENIINSYLEKYDNFIKREKKYYDILKIDSTTFSRKGLKNNYVAYFVLGIRKEDGEVKKECIYFSVEKGMKESKKGWEEVILFIKKNIKTELIISDMNIALKNLLKTELEVSKQNCLWHRLDSITTRIKGIDKTERNSIFAKEYNKLKYVKNEKQLRKILINFLKYDLSEIKTKEGKIQKKDIIKMISYYFKDNFEYLKHKKLIREYGKKQLYQNMDTESFISELKKYLKKNTNYSNEEILIFKIYTFLENKCIIG